MRERKMIDALKDLGEKVTGQPIEVTDEDLMMYGEDITEIIDEITKNYTGGGGGTTVVANPTLAGTESDLTGLQVGETKYKVDTGTNVVANPELEGGEDALTSLQVGNTKYAIQSGGTNYTVLEVPDTAPNVAQTTTIYNNDFSTRMDEISTALTSSQYDQLPAIVRFSHYNDETYTTDILAVIIDRIGFESIDDTDYITVTYTYNNATYKIYQNGVAGFWAINPVS